MGTTPPPRELRFTLAQRARMAVSEAAAYASVFVRGIVPWTADEHLAPGELKRCADQMVVQAERLQQYAVYYEISRFGWAAAATGDGYDEQDYRDMHAEHYAAWCAGDPYPYVPVFVDRATLPPAPGHDLQAVAARLDSWYAATGGTQITSSHAVSEGLRDGL